VLLGLEQTAESAQSTVGELLAVDPALGIVILCIQVEPELVQRMFALGVSAYLHKSISLDLLMSTIRDIAGSGRQSVMLSLPLQASATLPRMRVPEPAGAARAADVRPADTAPASGDGRLSEREVQVLTCVADALTNRQIAARLDITEGTVKRHLRNIFNKLGATSRIDAVNKGLETLPKQMDERGTERRH
jgi:DNA-binding NarL/FixJ family response regulator